MLHKQIGRKWRVRCPDVQKWMRRGQKCEKLNTTKENDYVHDSIDTIRAPEYQIKTRWKNRAALQLNCTYETQKRSHLESTDRHCHHLVQGWIHDLSRSCEFIIAPLTFQVEITHDTLLEVMWRSPGFVINRSTFQAKDTDGISESRWRFQQGI